MSALGHGHHEDLISWNREYGERKQQILDTKPKSEWSTRLRCMWQITPEQMAELPEEVVATHEIFNRQWSGYASSSPYKNYIKALEDHAPELEAWHQKHCPALKTPEGCPWDGKRLVGIGAW